MSLCPSTPEKLTGTLCLLDSRLVHRERLELLVKVAVQGSQSPQPHLEDGTIYYPPWPTKLENRESSR